MNHDSKYIQIQGVEQTFKTNKGLFPALRDIDLDIDAGEYISVMGPSGSGKSTLLNMLGLGTDVLRAFAGVDNAVIAHEIGLGPDAVGLSMGAGKERLLYAVAHNVRRVVATDLYDPGTEWDKARTADPDRYIKEDKPFPVDDAKLEGVDSVYPGIRRPDAGEDPVINIPISGAYYDAYYSYTVDGELIQRTGTAFE